MSYTFSEFQCPLTTSIQVGNKTISNRRWIEVSNSKIKVDLAPLPGLHTESLEESLEDFKAETFNTPSALFVKECFEIFTSTQETQVESNDLFYIDLNLDPSKVAKDLSSSIYKIKIGRNKLAEESIWLKEFINSVPEGIKLRLDGNRSFSLDSLNKYLHGIDFKKVQYLEEPLQNVMEWTSLERFNELDLAIDESINRRRELDFAKYIVAKPTFNISLKDTLKELALENQEVIISNSFDPPNNIKILKMIAAEGEHICGLDTLKYFCLEN
ncbi:hypothetical protein [Halobacteriovorax sp.]|uniref:hypothetical protein n=1 Tax=Halobacteriovorax sp. TaxID=2020862 RepID=UPI0035625447